MPYTSAVSMKLIPASTPHQNAGAGLLVGDVTKIHGSETKAVDFQAGAAKMRIVHKRLR